MVVVCRRVEEEGRAGAEGEDARYRTAVPPRAHVAAVVGCRGGGGWWGEGGAVGVGEGREEEGEEVRVEHAAVRSDFLVDLGGGWVGTWVNVMSASRLGVFRRFVDLRVSEWRYFYVD